MAGPVYYTDLQNINAGAEATTNWTVVGGASIGVDADNVLQGTNCLAAKVSNTVSLSLYDYYTANGNVTLNGSGKVFIAWMAVLKQAIVDTFANGGMRIYVEDATRWASWDVGGRDTIPNQGWFAHAVQMDQTVNRRVGAVPWSASAAAGDGGAAPDFTQIRKVGVILKTTGSTTGNTKNFFWDVFWLGTYLGVKRGDTTTPATWEGLFVESEANFYGSVQKRDGIYFLNTGIRVGSTTTGEDTRFVDSGKQVTFSDKNVGNSFYELRLVGNSTAGTVFQLGSVVGTGDNRQGTQGGTLGSAGPAWLLDAQTQIANLSTVNLYGVNIGNARRGVLLDDGTKTRAISCTFANCGEIDPGTTNSGAEVLSCNVIDPNGAVNNRGLRIYPAHNIKKVACITSGVPATQHLTHLPEIPPYSVVFDAVKFYGDYSGATIWHGEASASNAGTVTISKTNGADPVAAEFNATGTPASNVSVVASFTLTLTNIPEGVQVTIVNSGTRAELQNSLAPANGTVTYTHGGGETVDILFVAAGYDPNVSDVYDLTLPNDNSSIKVQMLNDPNYENPV